MVECAAMGYRLFSWRGLRRALFLFIFTLLLVASAQPLVDPVGQVRAYTRAVEFDYLTWTLDALWVKWRMWSLGDGDFMSVEQRAGLVPEYLALVENIREVEGEISRIYADPEANEPEAATADLRAELAVLSGRRKLLAPLAESVFQGQLSAVLADLGLVYGGQPAPPVLFHVTPPPNALIVSPRDSIRQDANISIFPGMPLDDISRLEDRVSAGLDVSSLVVGIGGVGVYPTMVMQTTDLNYLAEVVAHEWVHNFLTLRPLGFNYLSSAELRTFNETVANIAGKAIGRELVRRYYPELLPPPEPEVDETPEEDEAPQTQPAPQEPPEFDFHAEMRKTRLGAEKLLAEGRPAAAETYMELRRRYLWDHGYRIRKLNQAYFAFYGAYADLPGGAAGEDPVGAAVRALWSELGDIRVFLNRVSWMWSLEQLQRAVQQAAGAGLVQ